MEKACDASITFANCKHICMKDHDIIITVSNCEYVLYNMFSDIVELYSTDQLVEFELALQKENIWWYSWG